MTSQLDRPHSLAEATAALTAPGQLFEMEELVIRGVPTRVWKVAPPSLRAVLDMSLAHPEADFLVYEEERVTFEEHYRRAATLAHQLRSELGVQKGDRVAIAMRNLPEWVTAFWAAAAAGAVVVPLNAWWTSEELCYGLADSGSVVAFVDTERAERLRPQHGEDELAGLRAVVVVDEHRRQAGGPGGTGGTGGTGRTGGRVVATDGLEMAFGDVLGEVPADATPPAVEIAPEDDATIFYTSGTTGRPKGAVGTHRNACTNLMNLFFASTVSKARFGASAADAPDNIQRSFLVSVPFFHATGCLAIMMANTAAGGKLVMMHHFDAARALELIERERVTSFGGVPTVVMQVLDCPDLAWRDVSSVRSVSYGGAPAPPELVERIRRHFTVGQPSNGYGLTETSAMTAMNSGPDYVRHPDSVGRTVPVTDVVVVPADFEGDEPPAPAPPDQVGELWVKGPQVVRGYWHRPEDTALTFTQGWLHTGDVARIDDEGFIYIVDRAKDVIIRGGENIYSIEVEDALFTHPAVADCTVIGVPHPTLGEEVGAVVVRRPGAQVDAEQLREYLAARLPPYSVPVRFWFVDGPLPRNPAGKVLKRSLRDHLLG